MKRTIIRLLVIAVIMFAATSAFADYSYNFDVNTSSLSGTNGYLDLQFSPGSYSGTASAVVSNFSSDAALNSVIITGDVTGALPGTITLNNTTGFNDYYQAVTFGNNVHFSLNLSGAADNAFGLFFFANDGSTPLLTSDMTNGAAATVTLTPTGTVLTNNSAQTLASPTPIPAAAWLFGSGLMGLAGVRRRMAA
jgi:hypothetical protein